MFSIWWDTSYDIHNCWNFTPLSLTTSRNLSRSQPPLPPMSVLPTLTLINHHISSHHQASFAKELLDHMEERGHAGEVRCPHCRQQGGFRAAEVGVHYEGCVRHVNKFKCGQCDSRFRCAQMICFGNLNLEYQI